jgi:hypothetical protein
VHLFVNKSYVSLLEYVIKELRAQQQPEGISEKLQISGPSLPSLHSQAQNQVLELFNPSQEGIGRRGFTTLVCKGDSFRRRRSLGLCSVLASSRIGPGYLLSSKMVLSLLHMCRLPGKEGCPQTGVGGCSSV